MLRLRLTLCGTCGGFGKFRFPLLHRLRIGCGNGGCGFENSVKFQGVEPLACAFHLGFGEVFEAQVRIRSESIGVLGVSMVRGFRSLGGLSARGALFTRCTGRTGKSRAGFGFSPLFEGLCGCVRAGVCGLIQLVPSMPFNPDHLVVPAGACGIERFEQVTVLHGFTVGLFPAAFLPPGHPLGEGVNHVLAVAVDQKFALGAMGGRLKQVENCLDLAHIVGTVLPAPCCPVVLVNVPCPTGRPGITKRGAVSRRNNLILHALDFTLHTRKAQSVASVHEALGFVTSLRFQAAGG